MLKSRFKVLFCCLRPFLRPEFIYQNFFWNALASVGNDGLQQFFGLASIPLGFLHGSIAMEHLEPSQCLNTKRGYLQTVNRSSDLLDLLLDTEIWMVGQVFQLLFCKGREPRREKIRRIIDGTFNLQL